MTGVALARDLASRSELASAVYEGVVRHRRHSPQPHAFRYRVAQLYLDLEEIERVFEGRWLWSVGRRNVAEFRRSDYLGRGDRPLIEAVRDCAEQASGRRPLGPVRLLTHVRYGGYVFNPVSFYYCFGADGTSLECLVAEITNTPWGERHVYALPVAEAERQAGAWRWSFDKAFHISPFLPMNRRYGWRASEPGKSLRVHIEVLDGGRSEFDATLVLERRPLDGASLRRVLWRYPLMTAQVMAGIHWQALKLWAKRNPVYTHPSTAEQR
jgi:DUF1365 family protein